MSGVQIPPPRPEFLPFINHLSPEKPLTIPAEITSDNDLSDIEINDDFKTALRLIEEQNENVYVTGKAGTGKSTFLKYLRTTTGENMAVLAPTGLSAINIGGQTIHSFFRLPPKLINRRDIRPSKNPDLYRNLDAIIIDEVSNDQSHPFNHKARILFFHILHFLLHR